MTRRFHAVPFVATVAILAVAALAGRWAIQPAKRGGDSPQAVRAAATPAAPQSPAVTPTPAALTASLVKPAGFQDLDGDGEDDREDEKESEFERAKESWNGRPLPGADLPGEALKFRLLSQRDENGVIPMDGLVKGKAHVDEMLAADPQRVQDIEPIAGISRSTWTSVGPGNIGGRVRSIAIHPTTPATMFAGSVGGGIWKTIDTGASWAPVDDFLANIAVSTIIFDPADPSVMYAGTGEGFYNQDGLRGAGIFKSTNGGTTWTQLAATNNSNFRYVNRLTGNIAGTTILAATRTGIYRTQNFGTSWTNTIATEIVDVDFNPNDSTKAVASGQSHNAWYSIDTGGTWTPATGLPATGGRVEIAYAPSSPNIVYASIDVTGGSIYKSVDGGVTYALVSAPAIQYLGAQGWYDNALWVNPVDPNVIIVGGIDLYKSTDGGVTISRISRWQSSPSSAHADHHVIVAPPGFDNVTNKTLFFGNDGGIYKATDWSTVGANSAFSGGTNCEAVTPFNCTPGWTSLNNNLGITQFYGGAGFAGTGRLLGGTQDNGTLVYNGTPNAWATEFGGDGGWVAIDPTNANTLYGEYVYAQVHRSLSGSSSGADYITGLYWTGSQYNCKPAPYNIGDVCTAGAAPASTLAQANFIAPFILDPNAPTRLLVGGRSLWRTNDATTANTTTTGPTWAQIKTPNGVNSNISAIAVAPGNSDRVWVGHNNGDVFMTTNGTAGSPTWTQVDNGGTPLPNRVATRVTVDPSNSNIVYATFGGYSAGNLWRSTDNGTTWADISGSGGTALPSVPVRDLDVLAVNSNWLYAATEIGVFASADNGATWGPATISPTDGPANVSVDELFFLDNATLVAATHGRGMFKTTVTTTPGTINGTVWDDGGVLAVVISGATITVSPGGQTTTTSGSGFYSITVPPGTYTVTASKAGYGSFAYGGVVVSPGGTTTRDFLIGAAATISGSVRNATNNAAITNATLTFDPGGLTASTDGSGNYSKSIAARTYSVTASAPGFLPATVTGVVVNYGGAATRDFLLAVDPNLTAVYDATLKAPKCTAIGVSCDSGPALLLGRGPVGPEPNQPNTINNFCADGSSGSFHSDESNDRLKVATLDHSLFAPGKTVTIEATVWAFSGFTSDFLDLYYAADATNPTWTFITTLTPTASGAQTLSATYTLPAGALQAVRANFRYQGAANPCASGSYDDHDDLIFASAGGAISGRVTNAATTGALASVPVQIYNSSGTFVTSASTDASGNYTSPALATGSYRARTANSSGFVDKLYNDITCLGCNPATGSPIAVTAPNTTANIDFALNLGGRFSGAVTNTATAAAMNNVSVQIYNAAGIFISTVASDASGNYLSPVLPAGSYFARTTGTTGFVDELYNNIPCSGCDPTTGTPIVVTPPGTNSGIHFALSPVAVPPGVPANPSPSHLAWSVLTTASLSWSSSGATAYDVAFGTTYPPPSAATNLVSASYAPTLAAGTTYYWRVTAKSAGGTTVGPVWQFATLPPGTDLVTDTFTGANGTLLSAHAPDVNTPGAPWVATGAAPAPTLAGNKVGIATGTGYLQATINSGVADAIVGADYTVGKSPHLAGLVLRLVDGNNHLMLLANSGSLQWYRKQGGDYFFIEGGPLPATPAIGTTHRIEARVIGTALYGYWDGVQVLSSTSAFQQSATRHGLNWNSASDATALFDNFALRSVVTAPGTPASPNPAHAATGVAINAALTWSASGATAYDVAFGTSNPPSTVSTDQAGATYSPTLAANTTYFWRITAKNVAGNTIGPVWSFTTAAAPGVPTSPNPAHAATGVATTASLTWTASGATTYDIAFGTANPPPSAATNLASASYSPAMTGGTTYFWRVTAKGAGGNTLGPVWSFTTNLPGTDLVTDTFTGANGTLLSAHAPDVNVPGAPWVASGAAPAPTLNNNKAGIAAGTGYLQATINSGVANATIAADYTVGKAPHMAGLVARLVDANNHLMLLANSGSLQWYRKQGGDYFLLAGAPLPGTPAIGTTHRIEARVIGTALQGYWNGVLIVSATEAFQQTATKHGLNWNSASDATALFDNFALRSVITPPPAPASPNPAHAATGVAITSALTWSAPGATAYDVAFGTTNPPSTVSTDQAAATYAPTMAANTTYFWRITAKNVAGNAVGPLWSFTTAAAPGVPANPNPAHAATGVATNASLTWSASGATTYDIAFGTANPPPSAATNLASASYTPAMAPSTTYFWRVTAKNAGGNTVGPVWSFTTQLPGDQLVFDTFTGADATPLTTHAPDVNVAGNPWVATGASPAPSLIGNRVGIAAGTGYLQATVNTTAANVVVSADYRVGKVGASAGLSLRQVDANNQFMLLANSGSMLLYRKQAGEFTLLANAPFSAAPIVGATYRLEARAIGTTIQGYWNGVLVLSATDAFQQTATRHGLLWNSASDTTALFDNFEIRSVITPPVTPVNPNPADAATGVAITAALTWSASGATAYDVAFGTTNPPATVSTNQAAATYSPAMVGGTTYFWRITAKNVAGNTVGPVWSFTTAAPPGVPANPSPSHGSTSAPTNATLTWSASGATTYDVAFGTTNPPPSAAANLASAGYAPAMAGTTTYFWRVTAKNAGGNTVGPVWSLTTLPPGDQLVFDTLTGADGTLVTAHAPDVNVAGNPWVATGASPVPALTNNKVGIAAGTGYLQATINTTAANVVVSTDYTVGKAGASAGLSLRQVDANNHFMLLANSGSMLLYRKQVGNFTLLASAPFSASPVVGTTYRLEARAIGTTIQGYWNGVLVVSATDAFQQTATRHGLLWNSASDTTALFDNFEIRSVITPPATPSAPNPADAATGVAITAALTWSASGATAYDVAFGTTNPPSTVSTNQAAATYSPTMVGGTTYFWRITAKNVAGNTVGPVWSFTTAAPPGVPANPSPSHGSTSAPTNATLTWSASGATTYDVAFGTTNPPPSASANLASASYAPAMAGTTTYFWRVTAKNAGGSTVGPVWSLTTLPPGDQLVFDTLTGADGTLVTAHAPDVNVAGNPWVATGASPVPALTNNKVGIAAGTGYLQATINTTAANVVVSTDYRVGKAGASAGLSLRQVDANNHFMLLANSGSMLLYRKQAGEFTLLANAPFSAAPIVGATYRLEARAVGTTIQGYWNGVQVVSATDAFQQTATRHGLLWNSASDTTALFDNFEIRSVLSPPGTPASPNPANAATGQPGNKVLSWSASGATAYDVAFGTTNPPSTVSTDQAGPTYTPTLAASTTYFWRITAKNAAGNTVGPVWSFTTGAAPGVPTSPTPSNGATGVSSTAVLGWSAAGGTAWDVAFGTTNPPPSVVTNLVGTTSYSPAMTANTLYYWRVTAKNSNGTTIGPVWSFTTQLAGDQLVFDTFTGADTTTLPAHAADVNAAGNPWVATGASPVPTLTSNKVGIAAGTGYLQATINAAASDVLVVADYTVGKVGASAGLSLRQVDANNHFILLANSGSMLLYRKQAGNFTLLASAPFSAAPVVGATYRLEARAVGAAIQGYWNGALLVSATDAFQQTATRHGLLWNSASDTTALFDNFELRSLVTPPGPPATPTPADAATGVQASSGLTWSASGATAYDVAFGTTNPPPTVSTNQAGATFTPALAASTTYFWRVTSKNVAGSAVGAVWSFTTSATPADPGVPNNPTPVNGAAGIATTASLTWSAAGATTYDVAFGTTNPPPSAATDLVSASYAPAMAGSTLYYWRVTAKNGGDTKVGPLWSFTTQGDQVVFDTFTGTNDTLLPAHAPDLSVPGNPWQATGDFSSPPTFPRDVVLTNNKAALYSSPSGGTATFPTINSAASDVDVSANYTVGKTAHWAGLTLRYVNAQNYLLLQVHGGTMDLYRIQDSQAYLIGTGTFSGPAVGTTHKLEARAVGSDIQGYWNGVLVLSATEAFQQTATKHGLFWQPAVDATATFDSFEIRRMGPPPGAPGTPTTPSPSNASTDVSLVTLLSWTAAGANSFDIAYGTTNPPPTAATNQTSATYDPDITAGTTYFWRVTAKNAQGTTLGPVWSFTSVPLPPGAPTIVSPLHEATNVSVTGALNWTAPSGATSYELRFGTTNPPPTVSTNLVSPTYAPTMVAGTKYFWQVTAKNAGGATSGPVWEFTSSVPYSALDQVVFDTFTGTDATALTSHAPDFSLFSFWQVTGATPVPTLTNNKLGIASGTGNVEATIDSLTANAQVSVDYTVGKNEHWAGLILRYVNSDNYLLLVANGGSLQVLWRQFGLTTQLASAALPEAPVVGVTYQLKARMVNATLQGYWNGALMVTAAAPDWSGRHGLVFNSASDSTALFDNFEIRQMVPAPLAPNTPSPAPNETLVPANKQLSWSASGAATYDVAFGTVNPPPTVSSDQPLATYTPTLAVGTTYFWRITAKNSAGSTIGPVWSFTTAFLPSIPTAPTPANGSWSAATSAVLGWSSAGAATYDLSFGTTNPPPAAAANLATASYAPTMTAGTLYYWRVTAKNANGVTPGPVWSFATLLPGSQLVFDSFTGTPGTELTAHAPDVTVAGNPWVASGTSPAPTLKNPGKVWVGVGGSGYGQATVDSAAANVVVSADYTVTKSAGHQAGLVLRFVDSFNHLMLLANGGSLQLYQKQGGEYVLLKSEPFAQAPALGTTYRLEARAFGTTIEGYWNGVQILTATSNFQQSATRHGLAWNPSWDSSALFDNFEIRSVNMAPVPAIAGISPPSVPAGGSDFTLGVRGTNFTANSVVRLNGANRATTYVSSSTAVTDVDAFNPGASNWVYKLVTQPDGKIIVAGAFDKLGGGGAGVTTRNYLGRLNADGSLDTGFDPKPNSFVEAVALQSDGKIIIGGSFDTLGTGPSQVTRHSVARLNADGSVDVTFPDLGSLGSAGVYALAVQADGKILVGGLFDRLDGGGAGTLVRKSIGRLNADGSLDTTFDPGADGVIYTLVVQADGKILVGGYFNMIGGGGTGNVARQGIARLNADGSVEMAFNPGTNTTGVLALAEQPDGKILVGGNFSALGSAGAGPTRWHLGRVNADGSIDEGFNPGANQIVRTLVLQPDGKILVGGNFTTLGGGGFGTTPRNRIGRLNSDGSIDPLFDPGANDDVSPIAVQADGQIVLGGHFTTLGGGNSGEASRSFIGRVNASGYPVSLTAIVTAADRATAATHAITVFNPGPGGGGSNSATLTITTVPPAPTPKQ